MGFADAKAPVPLERGAGMDKPSPSPSGPDSLDPKWKEEFEPIVELISYQPHKTYVASPPELEMIFARTSAGQQPKWVL